MKQQELARLFYREVLKLHQLEGASLKDKIEGLYRLLNLVFVEVTQKEKIQFTTLFARIAFVCSRYKIKRQSQFYIHHFRKIARAVLYDKSKKNKEELALQYQLGLRVLTETIQALFKQSPPNELSAILPPDGFYTIAPVEVKDFKAKARIVVLSDDAEKEQLIVQDEDNPAIDIKVQYNIAERNENFNPTIKAIRHTFGFPLVVHLIDVEIDKEGIYRPRAFVVEPDYLVDVTAIAECFKNFGTEPLFHLLKKFMPFSPSKYLMIGNIANFFLDELMSNPESTFKELFPKVFRLNPLAFVIFEDREVREIMQKCQRHFVCLKNMVKNEFKQNKIAVEDCFLEPTFYSELYGLQGRLDVFHKNKNNDKETGIVELKSGKAYMPNRYGISHNHYTQTLLYDLLVKSTFGAGIDSTNYILYSGVDERNLRFAPTVKAQQFEAMQARNQLVSIERSLSLLKDKDSEMANIFNLLRPSSMPKAKGFLEKDLALFEKVYHEMSPLERSYFLAFTGFIAREHQLAKTGIEGIEKINGVASLWLNDLEEKDKNFELLSYLVIRNNNTSEQEPIIIFAKTERTNPLANFRKGDIAVLYPFEELTDTVLSNQLFKCSIIDITKTEVIVRLRSKQFNDSIFKEHEFWNLEHDLLDSSFVSMYRSLFAFSQYKEEKKNLLLGLRAPQQNEVAELPAPAELSDEQKHLFRKAMSAEEYFLLWGPPGTGKTSKMLKSFVAYLLNHTDENILLLAYTNRAVDEICEAVESVDKFIKDEYIRIGSRYSTKEQFQSQLLDKKIEKVNTRKELKEIIERHRIYVATVSSIAGKQELLQLKNFDRVIIDEASQILEPILVGLLPKFKRFILIGDHKQLPAVVVQDKEASSVKDKDLQAIGLNNLRDSLFERLFKRCIENKWDWAYDRLSQQGRMHEEVMNFPNQYFYEGKLKILPSTIPAHEKQLATIQHQLPEDASALEQLLSAQRLVFLPTEVDTSSTNEKTNKYEADLVAKIVEAYHRIYAASEKSLSPTCIGVITPYRAQIAQIKQALVEKEVDVNLLTIDTVERYQGGARDVIIISLCANSTKQLYSLVSLSDDGVDRKLNVALTRARQQLVILGNPKILEQNEIYGNLIKAFHNKN